MERWLRISEVREMFGGRSRASIYRDIERGHLPPPIKMGEINYWSEAKLRAFLERRSDAAAKAQGHGRAR